MMVALLIAGGGCLLATGSVPSSGEGAALAVAAVAAALPATRRELQRILERIRNPAPRPAWLAAAGIAVLCSAVLLLLAWLHASYFMLSFHDEHAYMIQMRMLAEGRLWLPPYPPDVREFFDTIYVLVEPKYAPIYFPGTALLYVPTVWLHLPFWVLPLAVAGASAGLLYRLVTELVDGVAGALSVPLLVSAASYRRNALLLLSQMPVLLLVLLMLLAWLRWRRRRAVRWAAAVGALAGWAVITRPVDAACYAVPVAAAMLLGLRGAGRRLWIKTLTVVTLAAAPFLTLQVVQNVGVAGSWSRFPSDLYVARTFPAPMMGFHQIDWSKVPTPSLYQKRLLNVTWVWPKYARHQRTRVIEEWREQRLPTTLTMTLPSQLLLVLLPPAVFVLDRRRLVVVATAVLFLGFYTFYVFFLKHYLVVILPAVVLMLVTGIDALERTWPGQRAVVSTLAATAVTGLSVVALGGTNPHYYYRQLAAANHAVASLPAGERAVVLFRFRAGVCAVDQEPVYNTETAWPDDARVVRAHDLGERENTKLFRYYARHQPDRVFYSFDRGEARLYRLGTAEELAALYPDAS